MALLAILVGVTAHAMPEFCGIKLHQSNLSQDALTNIQLMVDGYRPGDSFALHLRFNDVAAMVETYETLEKAGAMVFGRQVRRNFEEDRTSARDGFLSVRVSKPNHIVLALTAPGLIKATVIQRAGPWVIPAGEREAEYLMRPDQLAYWRKLGDQPDQVVSLTLMSGWTREQFNELLSSLDTKPGVSFTKTRVFYDELPQIGSIDIEGSWRDLDKLMRSSPLIDEAQLGIKLLYNLYFGSR